MKRIPEENGKQISMLRHVHGDGHVCTYGGQRLTLSVSSRKLQLTVCLDCPAKPLGPSCLSCKAALEFQVSAARVPSTSVFETQLRSSHLGSTHFTLLAILQTSRVMNF